jgi:hypothetical protein
MLFFFPLPPFRLLLSLTWPGPPFILKGIPQWPNYMRDRCHTTLSGGVALQG